MNDIKIIFLDIDGTIRRSNKSISKKTIAAINKAKLSGIEVVLTTGRSFKYALSVSKECGINGYLISSSGSEIYDIKNNNVIYNEKIDKNESKKLYDYCHDNNLNFLANTYTQDYQTINESLNREYINDFKDINDEINQIVITSYNYEKMINLVNNFNDYNNIRIIGVASSLLNGNLNPSIDYYIDIVNKKVSKYYGIKKLLNYLNIDKKNALACGDSMNDIEMVENVGIGVAMGNAIDDLKEVADIVIRTNDEDGVAELIEKVVKKETI